MIKDQVGKSAEDVSAKLQEGLSQRRVKNITSYITTFALKQIRQVENHPIQVVPGRAGGGSFRRKKKYIAKKEFAYRMCARRPTSAMPKPFLCCERAFCCSMVVMCRGVR